MDNEVDFPRGGPKSSKRPRSNDAISSRSPKAQPLKQKRCQSFEMDKFNPENTRKTVSVSLLTYEKIQEGMLILGCVRKVTSFYLEVELPGRVFGKLELANLSSAYVNYMQELINNNNVDEIADLQYLQKLYRIGQIIPTRVIFIERGEKTQVFLSIDPSIIHQNLNPASCKEQTLLWAAIASKSDHGYLLDVGNDNCRVFLPFENIDTNIEFRTGETIWSIIQKASISSGISTVRVSALLKDITESLQHTINLDTVIPGFQFLFKVTKILQNGLEGTLANGNVAYVHENHLRKPLQKLSKYPVGSSHEARVLYVEPLTKILYLTFRKLNVFSPPEYQNGNIIEAKIISKTMGGMYVNLLNHEKGFISEKRLISSFKNDGKETLSNFVKRKFPIGSSHNCKILAYNPFEHLYICTPENEQFKEVVYNANNLNIGDKVKVVVTKIVKQGVWVKLDSVTGYITNIHLTNMEYNENIKKKIYVNQNLLVRVWDIHKNIIYFTHKEAFLQSGLYFRDIEDVEINKQYLGMVVNTNGAGDVLVTFYAGTRGYLPKPDLTYFNGQVILITVIGKTSGHLLLSLTPPLDEPKDMKICDCADGVVEEIHGDHLILKIQSMKAKLPAVHISSCLSLNCLLLDTFEKGNCIKDVLCIGFDKLPIVSLREAIRYNDSNFKILAFKDIQVGTLLRGLYESRYSGGINVLILMKSCHYIQNIPYEDLSAYKKIARKKFQHHQPILLKVLEIDQKKGKMKVTAKMSELGDYDRNISLNHLESYLYNYKKILNNVIHGQDVLHLSPGQRVQCTVAKLDESGCAVLINNTFLQGLVNINLCPKNIYVGQNLEGAILWIEPTFNYVHVVLDPNTIKEISETQDAENVPLLSYNSTLKARILMVDTDFVIGVLVDTTTNNQLIYLPTFIHDNSFTRKMERYMLLEVIKVKIYRKVENFIIGLDEKHARCVIKDMFNNTLSSTQSTLTNSPIATVDIKKSIPNPTNEKKRVLQIEKKSPKIQLKNNPEKYHKDTTEMDIELLNTDDNMQSGFSNMNQFFTSRPLQKTSKEDSSDDEVDLDKSPPKKRKRLSAVERAEQVKQKEEEIRKKEIENADSFGNPQNPDQFDRRLLGNPNSSELWSKYISYYVTQTEFDKARAIAQRALKTIQIDQSVERYNIWIVLLNLENSHGDKASFEEVFQDAVRCNDSLDIYLKVIEMLFESHKFDEAEEKIRKVRQKFKDDSKMWTTIIQMYYVNKNFTKARDFRKLAIQMFQKKEDQINLIIQCGLFEFRFGDANEAENLFETLLDKYYKNVNIWNTYIDQVIKTGNVEKARRIFDRAIATNIPIKKKQTLFNKYQVFELKYGNQESLQRVTQKFTQYCELE